MIQLECPNCGRRDVAEFRYVGERHPRPDPRTADPTTWRAYLYLRANPAGWTDELWLHRAGCRRYLAVRRHTVTNEIGAVREAAPEATARPERAEPTRTDPGGPV